MYIAICDDLSEELDRVSELLEKWKSDKKAPLRYRCFSSAMALLDAAGEERFDLYLLDIMMPGMSGIDAAAEIRLRDEAADIVFLTTSPGFAYESYGVRALDYLLKPVQKERLYPILDKLLLREQKPTEGLTVKCGTTFVRVLFSQLSYVEVSGKHLYFNMVDGTAHEVFGTLREFEPQLLQRQEFVRCHRAYIVNLLQAAELSAAGIRTFSGKTLPVSRGLYKEVQNKYMKALFTEEEG